MRLEIRTIMMIFSTFMAWILLFNDPLVQFTASAGLLCCIVLSRVSLRKITAPLIPLLPVLIIAVLFSLLNGTTEYRRPVNNHVLIGMGQYLAIKQGNIFKSLSFAGRIVNLVIATGLLLKVTRSEDFFRLCSALRLPSHITFLVTVAVRFIPELERTKQNIITSRNCRGGYRAPKFGGRLSGTINLMIALMINSILLAEKLSIALLNRCYGLSNRMTFLESPVMKKSDYLLVGLAFLFIIAGIFLRCTTPVLQL